MSQFTPWSATFGGVLIGLAAVLLYRLNGRVAGISGIASGMLSVNPESKVWNYMFLLGMLLGPFLYAVFTGKLPAIEFNTSHPVIVIAGLLVGLGTKLGSGCTSGHGICGLARLSPRSLVSVFVFMFVAILVVSLV